MLFFMSFSGRTSKASPLINFRCGFFIVTGFGIKGINKIAKDFITVSQGAQIEGVGPRKRKQLLYNYSVIFFVNS